MPATEPEFVDWTGVPDRELVHLGQSAHHFHGAMVALWDRYKKRLHFYIKYKLNFSRHATEHQEKYVIEDIIQNTFCDVLSCLGEYRTQYEVSTWIYTITNKHIVRYIRETQKHQGRTTDLDETHDQNYYMTDGYKPDQEYELKEFERIIIFFVQSLKRQLDQEVFVLYLQNLHTKNIAQMIHSTQDAARARLNRVIRKFRSYLKKNYPEYLNSVTLSQIKNLGITLKSIRSQP
jgi:RNA polymerase sigma factor (sigma-70 family)